MRALNIDKLIELDRMADQIKQPKIFGVFEDDTHYLSTLDLLLASTNETQNRNEFFLKNVLPHVSTEAMIDVGIGDGKLTGLVGRHFQEITIVDTSTHALDCVEQYLDKRNVKLNKITSSIVNANLPLNQFDLAMLSHTLYYIDASMWMEVTQKLLSSLKTNGLLVIVLNGGLDKDGLVDMFGGQHLEIDKFFEDCRKELSVSSIDMSYSTECYKTQSLSSMFHIVGLHLYDVGAVATHRQLTDYLTEKQDRSTQVYQFLVHQKFILISK